MTTTTPAKATRVPDDIARAVILPESYIDERNISYPALKWLRHNNPLGIGYVDGFDPLHLVTKYDDLVAIERQPELFASGIKNAILNSQAGDELIRGITGGSIRSMDVVPYMDAPEHTIIRRMVNPWFRPGNMKRFEERVRQIAKCEVDRLFSEHNGQCDFAADFGLLYPLRVLLALFGLSVEDEPLVMKLTQELFGANDPDNQRPEAQLTPDAGAQMWVAAIKDFTTFFHGRIVEARERPATEDLLSIIANSRIDGELVEERYVVGQFIGIAAAGHDTTSATLNGTMLALMENPDQFQLVRDHLELADKLVEESVRYVSPVRHFMRSATRDTVVGGVLIEEGDRLLLSYPSANRDEERFGPTADKFDVTIDRPKHAGFGFGPHQCLGMVIARLELKIMFEELIPRLRSVELAGDPKYTQTNFVGGIKSLPVRIEGS